MEGVFAGFYQRKSVCGPDQLLDPAPSVSNAELFYTGGVAEVRTKVHVW